MNHIVLEGGAWWDLNPEQRIALRTWMRENGLEADNIPQGEEIIVEDDHIVYWEIQREPGGRPVTQKDDTGELRIIAEERRVPLRTLPPGTTFRS